MLKKMIFNIINGIYVLELNTRSLDVKINRNEHNLLGTECAELFKIDWNASFIVLFYTRTQNSHEYQRLEEYII